MREREKVYAVYEWNDKLEMRFAAVEKVTAKKVFLGNHAGLAFGCARTIELADACFTPEDAIAHYVAKQMDEIERLEEAARIARQRIDAARALATAQDNNETKKE